MQTSSKIPNKRHQKALDVVERFKAQGGTIQELPVRVNEQKKKRTINSKSNKVEK